MVPKVKRGVRASPCHYRRQRKKKSLAARDFRLTTTLQALEFRKMPTSSEVQIFTAASTSETLNYFPVTKVSSRIPGHPIPLSVARIFCIPITNHLRSSNWTYSGVKHSLRQIRLSFCDFRSIWANASKIHFAILGSFFKHFQLVTNTTYNL